ncbi:MAG: aminotransferase class V-fold PLP-dependent enzyme, partial [Ardenticatenaceae bacterium]
MGAPQSVGLALGTEDLIRKISFQSFVGYEGRRIRGVGRPQKIDRQEIIGAVAAVKRWMTMNHEERLADAERRSEVMLVPLKSIPGLKPEMLTNIIGHQPFGVRLEIDPKVAGMTAQDVVDRLKQGDPPIWTRVRDGERDIILHVFGLNEGEDKIVGERIAALFKR